MKSNEQFFDEIIKIDTYTLAVVPAELNDQNPGGGKDDAEVEGRN